MKAPERNLSHMLKVSRWVVDAADYDVLLDAVAAYFTALDIARRVKGQAGSMGLDSGPLQDLEEAEAKLRDFLNADGEQHG